MILGAGLFLAAAVLVCLAAILPLHYALILGATVVWFTLPGVFIARVIYAKQPGARIGSWLLGGVLGHAFSSLALLLLWVGFFALFRGISQIVIAFELRSRQHA